MIQPELRPLSVGEILDVTFRVYTRHFVTLVKAVAAAILPIAVFGSVAIGWMVDAAADDGGGGGLAFLAVLLLALVSLAAAQVGTAACLKVVGDAYLGVAPDWQASLRFASSRLPGLLWLVVLTWFLLTLALFAFVVPFVYLFVAWSVAVPVLVFEGPGGRQALGRSRELVRGRWWPTLGAVALGFVLAAMAAGIGGALAFAIVGGIAGTDSGIATVAGYVIDIATELLTVPFTAALVGVLYFDLRVRREGLDSQHLAARLDVPPPGSPPPPPPPPR